MRCIGCESAVTRNLPVGVVEPLKPIETGF